MSEFYSLWTDTGLQQMGETVASDAHFSMPTAVVGDGDGSPVTPTKGMTQLTNPVWEGPVGSITRSRADGTTYVYEFSIPAIAGPFTVREVGLKDASGTLCIVGNFPETEKPVATNGTVRDMVIRIPVHFENAEKVSLVVDPLAVASIGEVDRKIKTHNVHDASHEDIRREVGAAHTKTNEHKASQTNPHGVTKAQVGLGNLPNAISDAVNSNSSGTLATSKAVKTTHDKATNATHALETHNANKGNPHGVTKAQVGLGNLPNAISDAVNSSSQSSLATSKAVKLVNDKTAPATESSYGTTLIATQAETNEGKESSKMIVPAKLKAWWDTARLWTNIKNKPTTFPPSPHIHMSSDITINNFIGMIAYFECSTPPIGWLEANGLECPINATQLSVFLSGRHGHGPNGRSLRPDLRGEFIRGWDNGRGVNAGRKINSWEKDTFRSHHHQRTSDNRLAPSMWGGDTSIDFHSDDAHPYDADYRGSQTTGNSGEAETRPRNIALLVCIYAGIEG